MANYERYRDAQKVLLAGVERLQSSLAVMDSLAGVSGDSIKTELESLKNEFVNNNNALVTLLQTQPELAAKSYFSQDVKGRFVSIYKEASGKLDRLIFENKIGGIAPELKVYLESLNRQLEDQRHRADPALTVVQNLMLEMRNKRAREIPGISKNR